MSSHKHTPGPWVIKATAYCIEVDTKEEIVSEQYLADHHDGSQEEFDTAMANARLIAAAPDLLEALIDCRNELAVMLRRHNERNEEDGSSRYDGQAIGEVDEVIIKATGGDV